MADTSSRLEELREVARRRIEETHVAGRDTRHSRSANLQAIRGLVAGEPHYTFGIKGVDRFRFEEVLDAIAAVTRCSRDPAVTTGGGYISPGSALKGLEEAAARIAGVARDGGRFLLATGHPGSMLLFYVELSRQIRRWGGEILEPARGALVPPNLDLDYIDGVAVTTDRCSLMHTHDHHAMEIMLPAAGSVDLAVVDHGYAGAAINAGVPVVAPMDTNDPALAVAKRLGADLTIVPMDDNRPPSCYLPIVETIREFGELVTGTPARRAGAPAALANGWGERLRAAERVVAERAGPAGPLDELVLSLVESYHDQFLQTHFGADEDERLTNDPALAMVVYRRLQDALRRATLDRLRLAETGLRPDEIVAYVERNGAARSRESQP